MTSSNRALAVTGLMALILLTSGCMEIESDIYVTEDAELDRMDFSVGMEPYLTSMMEEDADEGLEEEIEEMEGAAEEFEQPGMEVGEIEVDLVRGEDMDYIEYSIKDIETDEDFEGFDIREEDGHIIYEEDPGEAIGGFEDSMMGDTDADTHTETDTAPTTGTQESQTQTVELDEPDIHQPEYPEDPVIEDPLLGDIDDEIEEMIDIEYRIHMPGEIVETNGEIRDDTTAVFDTETVIELDEENEPYYVESTTEEPGIIGEIVNFLTGLF